MKDLLRFPLNIQLFGEGEEAETQGDENNSGGSEEPKVLTQADIDRAVSLAVNKRDEKHAQDMSKAVADAVKEQQRLAALSEEERNQEARKAAELALAEKEAELNQKELTLSVGELLIQENLPKDCIGLVMGNDIEETKTNVAALKTLVDEQVQLKVDQLITKPGAPKRQNGSGLTKEDIMKEQDQAKRQQMIKENIHLFG